MPIGAADSIAAIRDEMSFDRFALTTPCTIA